MPSTPQKLYYRNRLPMILPTIMYGHEASFKIEIRQRDARDWLRRIEQSLSTREGVEQKEDYVTEELVDLDTLRRDAIMCRALVLQKSPSSYIQIIDSIKEATLDFDKKLSNVKQHDMKSTHASLLSRLELYRKKWQGIETYAQTTLLRLELSTNLLYNLIAQKESKPSVLMAGEQIRTAAEQKKLAIAAKRDATSMKALSLLGMLFLPGAYLASMFSSSFFNFQTASDPASVVSPRFWIYWVLTIPVTAFIVGAWYQWEKRRTRRYNQEEADVEKDVETGWNEMEKKLMVEMRERAQVREQTLTKERIERDI